MGLAIRQVVLMDNPLLRRKSKRVRQIDSSIQRLFDDMIDTMRSAHGVGLAAPQVGVLLRVIVIEVPEREVIALINPEIVKKSGEELVEEGCLSLPGYRAMIKRAVNITVKGRDGEGKECRIKADELLAQALQHEIDHLNGVLYIDYLESLDQLYKVEPKEGVAVEAGGGGQL